MLVFVSLAMKYSFINSFFAAFALSVLIMMSWYVWLYLPKPFCMMEVLFLLFVDTVNSINNGIPGVKSVCGINNMIFPLSGTMKLKSR